MQYALFQIMRHALTIQKELNYSIKGVKNVTQY